MSKEFLKGIGCHIGLGRGHLLFETLGVRAVVTSEQSTHLLLPLTSFGPQGRISSDECAIYRATCDSSRQEKIHSWIASASDRRSPETGSIDFESQYGTDGQEQNPCDETRDYWGNRKGRWVRVRGIARRTLFDLFMMNSHKRRRTTVKFLGPQVEMTIDDTWPHTGEMRRLWKGTTELWTRGGPQDDTWKTNGHHSNILPLFRNHLTRNAVAMLPSFVNPVAQAEHERRDSHLSVVSHTEHAEENGRRAVLGLPEFSDVYSTHHGDSSCATEPRDAAVEAANPAVNDRIPAKGCRHFLVKPWASGTGKGKHVSTVWSHYQRQG